MALDFTPRHTASIKFSGSGLGNLEFNAIPSTSVHLALSAFYKGADGLGSGPASISDDPNNGLIIGSDSKLYVPEAFALTARFAELVTEQAKTEARQNLGLQNIDGGTFT